jgi:hypothetical protein
LLADLGQAGPQSSAQMYLQLAQSFAYLLQVLGQRTIYWMNRGE